MKFYIFIYILFFFIGNKQVFLLAEEIHPVKVITYYMDHGNIEVIESGHIRLVKNNKEHYRDVAGIDPKTNALERRLDSPMFQDQVSVTRYYYDPITKENTFTHYFDCEMRATLRHGYHQAHYQYHPCFPKKKISKCFMDIKGNPTTLFGGNVAQCEYVYPPLFPYLCFIFFFDKTGRQVNLIINNVQIRAIFYDFTPNLYLTVAFPYNVHMYCSKGNSLFFLKSNRGEQEVLFDALL